MLVLSEETGSSGLDKVRQCICLRAAVFSGGLLASRAAFEGELSLCTFRITSHRRWMITQQHYMERC